MPAKVEPDLQALRIAHFKLRLTISLEEALKNQQFSKILKNVARRHMQRAARFDHKRVQANDND